MLRIRNWVTSEIRRAIYMAGVSMIVVVWAGLVLGVGWSVRGIQLTWASLFARRGSDRDLSSADVMGFEGLEL